MKSGLPSATSRMRSRAAASKAPSEQSGSSSTRTSVVGQRVEENRRAAQPAAAPVRPDVEQLGTGEAEHEHRRVAELDERLDEVEEGRRGPVDVVEDEQQRPFVREAASRRRAAHAVSSGLPRLTATLGPTAARKPAASSEARGGARTQPVEHVAVRAAESTSRSGA